MSSFDVLLESRTSFVQACVCGSRQSLLDPRALIELFTFIEPFKGSNICIKKRNIFRLAKFVCLAEKFRLTPGDAGT